jgi:protein involved in polysaccharide export with SLBB domain
MSDVALAQTLERQSAPGVPIPERARTPSPFGGVGAEAQRGQGPYPQLGVDAQAAESLDALGARHPLPLQPVDEPLDPERYVTGPGDVFELHFWGVENFRLRVTVDLEGRAFVPKVGYLALRGKTLGEVERLMRVSVARYFPTLHFGLTLAEPRTFLVQVVDDVMRPGPYPARAVERVATLVARAGGFGPNASMRRVEVKRRDGTSVRADLLLYAITGDVKHNPYVLDGDVVRVPYEALVASIGGAVNRAGRFELVEKGDLAELVELAGGLSANATRGLPIAVVRREPEERLRRLLFDFAPDGRLPALTISPGDGVWIPAFEELQRSVTITGALAGVAAASPGVAASTSTVASGAVASDEAAATRRLPYAEGDTVRTLLERVGGPGPLADLKGSYIMRTDRALPVDLYALVMLRDLSADRTVELGDTIVIPFKRQNVLVEGAVFRPGPYPYNPTFAVEQYVALAGGLNRFAQDMDDVYVVTPAGQMKPFAPDLRLEPGASLVVPERTFSRSEVVALIIAGAGLLLSAATIFLTLRK